MNTYFVDLKNGGSVMVNADMFKVLNYCSESLCFKTNDNIVMVLGTEYIKEVVLMDENDNYVKVF